MAGTLAQERSWAGIRLALEDADRPLTTPEVADEAGCHWNTAKDWLRSAYLKDLLERAPAHGSTGRSPYAYEIAGGVDQLPLAIDKYHDGGD